MVFFNFRALIAFLILSLCLTNVVETREWDAKTREFLKSYLKNILGSKFELDPDCLSGNFDNLMDTLDVAFYNHDIKMFTKILAQIFELEYSKCPYASTMSIFKDFRVSFRNGVFLYNSVKYSNFIYHRVSDFLYKADKSPESFGDIMGQIAKITIYGSVNGSYSNNKQQESTLKFLQ